MRDRLNMTRSSPLTIEYAGGVEHCIVASYSTDDIREHFDDAMGCEALVSTRMMLDVAVQNGAAAPRRMLAVNDCVVHTGPPYRILSMEIAADGFGLTTITADGLIVSTPTGSTAHNLAAGGPVLDPEVEAIIMTSICPHSFAHRPVVMAATTTLSIKITASNESSSVMIDGQDAVPAPPGTTVTIRRADVPFRLVRQPRRSAWQTLVYKLKWGDGPAALANSRG